MGAGRYAEVMARWGAEVVGVDLTRAVDAAAENLRAWPGVHLVQADIFALPFRDETFDLAYSIGVLHHTPDTAAAFKRVAAMVKKGGQLAVYVYHAGGLMRYVSDTLRVVTTRLPRPVVYYGSLVAVPLHYVHQLPVVGPRQPDPAADHRPPALAVALARHVRLVHAEVPVEASVSGGAALVPRGRVHGSLRRGRADLRPWREGVSWLP